jgi:dihydroorotate dehydrogenase electron transfer subunit
MNTLISSTPQSPVLGFDRLNRRPQSLAYALPTPFPIRAIHTENHRTKTFVLDGRLDAYPGQFVMAWLPRFDEKPFSLVDADPITLMVTAVGPFSRLLHEKRIGDPLWVRGPFGRGFHVEVVDQRLALVGGGYGVAPLHWLARTQLGVAGQITAIIGARSAEDVLYDDRFVQLAEASGETKTSVDLIITTEDSSRGVAGRVTHALEPLLKAGRIDGIYACGPHGMLAALESLGATYTVPTQLSWEAYMRCAIGICGACEHEGKLLCLDGPVLGRGRE